MKRALLFDLDHTLFDTPKTERRALRTVASAVDVPLGPANLAAYQEVNLHVWSEYRAGRITSKELRFLRFKLWLEKVGRPSHDPEELGLLYLSRFMSGGDLIHGAHSAVRSVSRLGFRLGVVTNGIDHVQRSRLKASGLSPYFKSVITSERAGFTKPDPRIMEIALKRMRVAAADAIYVGDDPDVDGLAAHRAGVEFVWFNPDRKTASPRSPARNARSIARLADLPDLVAP